MTQTTFPYEFEIEVAFRDIDAMGHVNNAVFFTYFEEGRKAFLEEVLGIHEPSEYPFILAHVHCDYVKPIRLGDSLCIHVWIGVVGSRKFSFKYKRNGTRLCWLGCHYCMFMQLVGNPRFAFSRRFYVGFVFTYGV